MSDSWERFGVAVEDEAECIDDLVRDKDVPWEDSASNLVHVSVHRLLSKTSKER